MQLQLRTTDLEVDVLQSLIKHTCSHCSLLIQCKTHQAHVCWFTPKSPLRGRSPDSLMFCFPCCSFPTPYHSILGKSIVPVPTTSIDVRKTDLKIKLTPLQQRTETERTWALDGLNYYINQSRNLICHWASGSIIQGILLTLQATGSQGFCCSQKNIILYYQSFMLLK